jgi:hypothetical protein
MDRSELCNVVKNAVVALEQDAVVANTQKGLVVWIRPLEMNEPQSIWVNRPQNSLNPTNKFRYFHSSPPY